MKVFLDSVGCKLNQSEIERYATQFRMAGHTLVATAEESDLVIINTCTVTSAAAADSRTRARQAHRRNSSANIVLTGCWSTLVPEKALQLPGVMQSIENQKKDQLVPIVLGAPKEMFDQEPLERQPIPGIRMRTRAFIKTQDGCDNHCTFCLTTIARGPSRSISVDRIVREIHAAVGGGTQEVVLTGVQLSSYGKDLGPSIDLVSLVRTILAEIDVPRIRLSSLEPWNLPRNFFRLWEDPRVCRHLHLPLQSGAKSALRRMARPISPDEYAELIRNARALIPDLALTTDIIVGFPGETPSEFDESLDFIQSMDFADAHVFKYSARQGTAARRLPDPIAPQEMKLRSKRVRKVISGSAANYRRQFNGSTLMALWESASQLNQNGWEMKGTTGNYLKVHALVPKNLWNTLTPVTVIDSTQPDLPVEVEIAPQ